MTGLDETPHPPAPTAEELTADREPRPKGLAFRGAHMIAAWMDQLDPYTAEFVGRILTSRESQHVFADARGRAVARAAAGRQEHGDQRRLARSMGLTPFIVRKLTAAGRASLADLAAYDPTRRDDHADGGYDAMTDDALPDQETPR